MNEELYYIQDSRTFVGNCMLFWCVDGKGYATDLDKAWRVDAEKAARMHQDRDTDIPRLIRDVDFAAKRMVDMQNLPPAAIMKRRIAVNAPTK